MRQFFARNFLNICDTNATGTSLAFIVVVDHDRSSYGPFTLKKHGKTYRGDLNEKMVGAIDTVFCVHVPRKLQCAHKKRA